MVRCKSHNSLRTSILNSTPVTQLLPPTFCRKLLINNGTKSDIIALSLPVPVDFITLRRVLGTKSSRLEEKPIHGAVVLIVGDLAIEFFQHLHNVPLWVGRYCKDGCEQFANLGKKIR